MVTVMFIPSVSNVGNLECSVRQARSLKCSHLLDRAKYFPLGSEISVSFAMLESVSRTNSYEGIRSLAS